MKKKKLILTILSLLVLALAFTSLFVGSSHMTLKEGLAALMKQGSAAQNRILWNVRIPRILAALIAGAGLAVSGLVMQTCLNNPLASPSTLGVSNAAVFGANLSIIVFAGGYLNTGNNVNRIDAVVNPFAASTLAFLFAAVSILLVLGLCRVRSFSPGVVVLSGIAIGSMWSAATTILQFYATDVGLSAAVVWSFGDLGRATYKTDLIMFVIVILGIGTSLLFSMKYNALLSGDSAAASLGVNVGRLRFLSMLASSLVTAVCVAYLGVIGFVGIICPHVVKKIAGEEHGTSIPATALSGSLLLLLADMFSRSIGNGSALPVGAITSLLGAPFFILVILTGRRKKSC